MNVTRPRGVMHNVLSFENKRFKKIKKKNKRTKSKKKKTKEQKTQKHNSRLVAWRGRLFFRSHALYAIQNLEAVTGSI